MSLRLVLILFLLTACGNRERQAAEQHWLEFPGFRLKTPVNWMPYKLQGKDCYVGGLTNGVDTLMFDYGYYGVTINEEEEKQVKYAIETVNGHRARIAIPIEKTGPVMMWINESRDSKFFIFGEKIQWVDDALQIFRSVVFETSDTTKNMHVAIDSFKIRPIGAGKKLLSINCVSCHHRSKKAFAPSFQDILQHRNEEWIYKFLTDRKSMVTDTITTRLIKEYGQECVHFPDLVREDVAALMDWL
jgi:hypothetical protein